MFETKANIESIRVSRKELVVTSFNRLPVKYHKFCNSFLSLRQWMKFSVETLSCMLLY